MGSKSSRETRASVRQERRSGANNDSATGGGGTAPPTNMPPHLANQYRNSHRQLNSAARGDSNRRNQTASQPSQPPPDTPAAPPQQPASNPGNENNTRGNNRGVQEGQMVKMLATIEASTVSYVPDTQLLTFYVTSICPSLTYEIHTGVKEFVRDGDVFYMPNKPKVEPTRTALEGEQDDTKVVVKLDVSKLEEKEMIYSKHYPKQMPCVIVLRYRTTELRKTGSEDESAPLASNASNHGEVMVVEHTEHTAVDLAETPRRRVISQIVTAGGNAYVVENLYGADTDNAAGGGEGAEVMVGSTIVPHEGEEDEDGLCVICLTNMKDTAVMPCRHMCMCKECGEQLLKHKPVCPVCRAPISTLLHMATTDSSS